MTDPSLDDFAVDGVAVVRAVLSPDELDELRSRFGGWLNQPELGSASISSQADDRPAMRTALLYWPDSSWFRSAPWLDRIADHARVALEAPRLRFFNASLFAKPAGCDVPVPWHQDLTYYPLRGTEMVTLWISLDGAFASNGALEYVVGSHTLAESVEPSRFRQHDASQQRTRRISAIVDAGVTRSWDLDPGDVALHHGLTWHRSTGNGASVTRRGLAVRFIGADVSYEPDAGVTTIPGVVSNALDDAAFPVVP
jgi:ectoine hydroxylase-related dioxygenase (phytanoyl-CoA dioxygenase family)